jgi:uncharacterized protein with PQ loop repeat
MISTVHATEILLLILGVISVLAAIPQLYTLWQVKASDQFNLFSWFVWFGYQATSCVYSYSIRAYVYFGVNIAWTLFYALMLVLIIKFRD